MYKADLNLGWDDPMPDHTKEMWVCLIQMLNNSESIRFLRTVRPKNAIGDIELIIFNHGFNDAMCTAALLRW